MFVKNHNKLSKIINENNFSNDDTILIIRTFLLKAKRLLNSVKIWKRKSLETVISNYKPHFLERQRDCKTTIKIMEKRKFKKTNL